MGQSYQCPACGIAVSGNVIEGVISCGRKDCPGAKPKPLTLVKPAA